MKSIRLPAFDIIKAIAILLVLYGHCEQHLVDVPREQNTVYGFVYTFHMPLFMMVSGYFASSTLRLPPWQFVCKKAKALLLPVATFSLGMAILYYAAQYRLSINLPAFLLLFAEQLGTWLWFLKSLFVCFCLLYVSHRCGRMASIAVLLAVLFVPWLNLCVLFPAFLFGHLLRSKGWLERLRGVRWLLAVAALFVVLYCFWSEWFKVRPAAGSLAGVALFLFKQAYRVLIGVSGALSVLLFCVWRFTAPPPPQRMVSRSLVQGWRFHAGNICAPVSLARDAAPALPVPSRSPQAAGRRAGVSRA